jgi:hypothetical protein
MEPLNTNVDTMNESPTEPPAASPSLPQLGSLANLAQSARMKHIKSAKTVLVIVGVLTIVVSLGMFVGAEAMVQSQIDKELKDLGPGMVVDQSILVQLKADQVGAQRFGSLLSLAEGVVFLLLGLNVQKAPVPLTATGLILYLADYAIGGVLDPMYLVKGILIKIIIVVCLFKALNAAIAYEREKRAAAEPVV